MAKEYSFSTTPTYHYHGSDEDVLNILVCQIKVWKAEGNKWFDVPTIDRCTVLNECESIEVHNTYKELISKAVVRLPRGTVISKITRVDKKVKTGNMSESSQETDLSKATASGQLISDESKVYDDGSSTLPITAVRSEDVDYGIIKVTRSSSDRLASADDFAMGSRIQIKAGYVDDAYRAEEIRLEDDPAELELIFTGFITGCSAGTPLEIECENMASMLKKVSCPKVVSKGDVTVNDFLKAGGTYHLLDGTGIELSPVSAETNINIGKVDLSSDVTVADVLTEWGKSGIMAFVEPDGKHIRVGRVLYQGAGGRELPNSNKEYLSYDDNNSYAFVQFDWDVAEDGLNVVAHDKRFLAVQATGMTADKKIFKLTVRANPNKKLESDDDYDVIDGDVQVVNERRPRKKKPRKAWGKAAVPQSGSVVETVSETKVDLSKYTVVPYIAKGSVTREQLIKEANEYRKKYTPNGIKGSLTLFGDVRVQPTNVIGLIDRRNPQKNGYYLIESVDTDFGVNGYRKKITIPYKIMNFKDLKIEEIR